MHAVERASMQRCATVGVQPGRAQAGDGVCAKSGHVASNVWNPADEARGASCWAGLGWAVCGCKVCTHTPGSALCEAEPYEPLPREPASVLLLVQVWH